MYTFCKATPPVNKNFHSSSFTSFLGKKSDKNFCTVNKSQSFNTHWKNYVVSITDFFTLLHESEAETACDHTALNFERQGGRFLQIIGQKAVSDCTSLYQTQF